MNKQGISSFTPHIAPFPKGMPANNPHALIATWFGSGLVRPAPGTAGSLAAVPVGYVILNFLGMQAFLIAIALAFFIGTISAVKYAQATGKHDDKSIVIDEVVGLWIAAIPAGGYWQLWLVAFALFRLFDIKKPWPASYFDKMDKPGVPVMMDDVIAGVFALLGTATSALVFLNP